jgi:hypothetical protein
MSDFGNNEVGAPVQRCPDKEQPRHWIEIQLVGEDGSPVAWEEYSITQPDGVVVTGVLGRDGSAHVDMDPAGNCVITFPRLDRDAWEPAP